MSNSIKGWLIFTLVFLYWYIIVSVSTLYYGESNDFNMSGALFYLEGETQKGDSCRYIGRYYKQKAENTILLLPKFLRP